MTFPYPSDSSDNPSEETEKAANLVLLIEKKALEAVLKYKNHESDILIIQVSQILVLWDRR